MGLQLNPNREPRRVALHDGAALIMRLPTSIDFLTAEEAMKRQLRAAMAGEEASLEGLGIGAVGTDDADLFVGLARYFLAPALAARIVSGWDAITDEAGEEIPFDAEKLALLFWQDPEVLQAFERAAR